MDSDCDHCGGGVAVQYVMSVAFKVYTITKEQKTCTKCRGAEI